MRHKLETLPVLRLFFWKPRTFREHMKHALARTVSIWLALCLASWIIKNMMVNMYFVG